MAFNNGLHKKKPETVIRMLNTIPKATVVCTTLLVFSSLLAPISLATMTEAPVAKPVKKPMNRKVRFLQGNCLQSMRLLCYRVAGTDILQG